MDLARLVSHCGMSDLAIWAPWKVSLSACRSDRVRRDCAEKITEHLPLAGFFLSDGVSHTHRSPEAQQRVGGCFLSLMPQMRTLYLAYCANHPSAVSVLTEHRFVAEPSGPEGKEGGQLCPLASSWSTFRHSKDKFLKMKMLRAGSCGCERKGL